MVGSWRIQNVRFFAPIRPCPDLAAPRAAVLGAVMSAALALSLSGCASVGSAISPGERFVELPRPGTALSIGQIVEIDGRSRRIDMVYDPRIPSEQAVTGDAAFLSSGSVSSLARRYRDLVKETLLSSGLNLGDVKVTVTLTDLSSRWVPKYSVYKTIQDQMGKNGELRSMIGDYAAVGTRFDVVSRTITARLGLSVTDATGKGLTLDSAALAKVSSALSVSFEGVPGGGAYVSSPTLVGIYADSRMMRAFAASSSRSGAEKTPK